MKNKLSGDEGNDAFIYEWLISLSRAKEALFTIGDHGHDVQHRIVVMTIDKGSDRTDCTKEPVSLAWGIRAAADRPEGLAREPRL